MKPVGNLVWILLISSLAIVASPANAQHSPLVYDSELDRLPWYDSQSNSLQDLPRKTPGRAASLDRGSVPQRIEPVRNNVPPAAPPMIAPDLSWARIFVWGFLFVVLLVIVIALIWMFFVLETKNAKKIPGNSVLDDERLIERVKQLPFHLLAEQSQGDLRQQAEAAAQNGKYGRATLLLYSHVLVSLDAHGLIQLKKSKTNRQYMNEIVKHPSLSGYFQKLMIPFEDHFFGNHDIEAQRFSNCWNELDPFLNEARRISEAGVS